MLESQLSHISNVNVAAIIGIEQAAGPISKGSGLVVLRGLLLDGLHAFAFLRETYILIKAV